MGPGSGNDNIFSLQSIINKQMSLQSEQWLWLQEDKHYALPRRQFIMKKGDDSSES